MKKTGVAIIGCGAISSTHAEAVVETDSAKLLMVADIDTKKAETLANKYGCDYTTDYKELLRNPDVQSVHLCTPHYLHAPMAKAFMEAGKHVLVEKPMGINFTPNPLLFGGMPAKQIPCHNCKNERSGGLRENGPYSWSESFCNMDAGQSLL